MHLKHMEQLVHSEIQVEPAEYQHEMNFMVWGEEYVFVLSSEDDSQLKKKTKQQPLDFFRKGNYE